MSEKYLFSWDNIPIEDEKNIDDEENLLEYLRDDCNIGWTKGAKIRKLRDDKTIRIHKDENLVEIVIDDTEKATLKVNDSITRNLKIKYVNGKMDIYSENLPDWWSNVFDSKPEKLKSISDMGLGYIPEPVAYPR
ncbi:MAG: hypothetical protein U9Q37_04555 [Euryarchaeota archaeon]|nr:hypothetical protein [Euryarchaeota archaeon]